MGRQRVRICLFLLILLLFPLQAQAEGTDLRSGDRVVIWSDIYHTALSATPSGNYQAGIEVAMDAGTLSGFGESEIWTITENADGSWCFEIGGVYLGLDGVSGQLTMGGAYDNWILSAMGDGTFRVVSRDLGSYLTWYSGRGVYGAAPVLQEQNILKLYVLPEETAETEAPAETETPSQTETTTATETSVETTVAPTTASSSAATETVAETSLPRDDSEGPQILDTGEWRLYFGQLHAHTADSDGVGTPAEAFAHASEVPGLDFFALTEHSDSFDNDKEGALDGDGAAVSTEWAAGKAAAEAVTDANFVGIYGFEMSWNQGQGHIATFNTSGWLSRNQDAYRKYRDGLENYYEALLAVPDSISQFNHPGTVYGDFKNFTWYSEQVDALVTLIEVGSGAGSEYQAAYDYYTRALDQGWHLAPTNNQNNHKDNFGDGDTNRTVVLASELTAEGIYDALRNYRVYATEDSDLEIYYTLNGSVMGSELSAAGIGDTAELAVCLYDPTDPEWGTVDVITAGGTVAASGSAMERMAFSLSTAADYYYIQVTQPDGDIAVTAPIWFRQADDIGISVLEAQTPPTRAGEEQTIVLELYNNEASPLTVTAVKLTDQNGNLLGESLGAISVERFETVKFTFPCCFETDGVYTLNAEVSAVFEGESRVLTRELELFVLPLSVTGEILIDGTHGAGRSYTEFLMLAADQQISVHIETDTVTAEQLAACRLLISPAPVEAFEAEFLEGIKDYVNQGGNLLLLGSANGSLELNRLLEALGSTMRLNADTAQDAVSNGGAPDQLYTANIQSSTWTAGVTEGQTYAHISGCTLDPGEGERLVKSLNGEVLLAADGAVLLAGSDFLADACLTVSDNIWALPYANRTIAENLLGAARTAPTIAPIAQVRTGERGRIYLVEGLVTAGTHNDNTTFPDTIYLQDTTGGIAAVGYSEHGLELGRRVQIIGCLEADDGNPQLRILNMEIFEKNDPIQPETVVSPLDYAAQGGELLQLEGMVFSAETDGEAVLWFVIEDSTGARTTVWIGDAIFSGSLGWNELARIVQVGNRVSAVGLCHLLNGETVLRVRDCDEVRLLWAPPAETVPETTHLLETTEVPTTAPTEAITEAPTERPAETPTEPPTEPVTESTTKPSAPPAAPADTGSNPPTGDTSFPVWTPILMLLSLTGAGILLKRGI